MTVYVDVVVNVSGFIKRHGLWTGAQHRLAKALAARVKKDKLKLFRVAWADPHGASRAKNSDPPRVPGRIGEWLQHKRRDHDSRCIRRADVRLFHARRRNEPRRNDGVAAPDHRSRSRNLSHSVTFHES